MEPEAYAHLIEVGYIAVQFEAVQAQHAAFDPAGDVKACTDSAVGIVRMILSLLVCGGLWSYGIGIYLQRFEFAVDVKGLSEVPVDVSPAPEDVDIPHQIPVFIADGDPIHAAQASGETLGKPVPHLHSGVHQNFIAAIYL